MQGTQEEDDLEIPAPTRHMVFSGNPGTGKTTWARLIGKIYKATGLLENASVTEVGPGDLIAGYIGQTREKAQKVFKKAMGGILFIDEAYGLTGADKKSQSASAFGVEALEVVLTEVENNRDNLVVILAGYKNEMSKMMTVNPGIPSRFPNMVDFENYSPEDMKEIIVLYSKPPSKGGEGSELTDKQKDPAPHPSQGDVTKGDGKVPKGDGLSVYPRCRRKIR